MARYYAEISKEKFLKKMEIFMMEYPKEDSCKAMKDLDKVEFDWENCTMFDDTEGFGVGEDGSFPVGHEEIAPGFHIFFAQAGGDWECPVCFIFYWSGTEIRGYIPKDGNPWDKKAKTAYNHEGDADEEDQKIWEKEFDLDLMKKDILKRIVKK